MVNKGGNSVSQNGSTEKVSADTCMSLVFNATLIGDR